MIIKKNRKDWKSIKENKILKLYEKFMTGKITDRRDIKFISNNKEIIILEF